MADESKVVAFSGTCPARGELTLVSKRISTAYRLRSIHAEFPAGAQNLLALRFYTAPDPSAPATGAPNGVSLLRDYGQVDYLVGDGLPRDLEHHLQIDEAGTWLKVHAVNTDWYDHAVNVHMTIELIERGM